MTYIKVLLLDKIVLEILNVSLNKVLFLQRRFYIFYLPCKRFSSALQLQIIDWKKTVSWVIFQLKLMYHQQRVLRKCRIKQQENICGIPTMDSMVGLCLLYRLTVSRISKFSSIVSTWGFPLGVYTHTAISTETQSFWMLSVPGSHLIYATKRLSPHYNKVEGFSSNTFLRIIFHSWNCCIRIIRNQQLAFEKR